MPTYTYECEEGHEFDEVASINSDARTRCNQPPKDAHEGTEPGACCNAPCTRVITTTPGVRWAEGAPTPRFHR